MGSKALVSRYSESRDQYDFDNGRQLMIQNSSNANPVVSIDRFIQHALRVIGSCGYVLQGQMTQKEEGIVNHRENFTNFGLQLYNLYLVNDLHKFNFF